MTRVEFRVVQMKMYYHLYSMKLSNALEHCGIWSNAKATLVFKKHAMKGLEYQRQLLNYVYGVDSKEES